MWLSLKCCFILCPLVFPHLPHVKQTLSLIKQIEQFFCCSTWLWAKDHSLGQHLLTHKTVFNANRENWLHVRKNYSDSGSHNVKCFYCALFYNNAGFHTYLSYTLGHLRVCFHNICLVSLEILFSQTMWKALWGLQCDTPNVILLAAPPALVLLSLSLVVA